jgi:alanine dehydrogenase
MPYTLALANFGWQNAIVKDPALAKGLNISGGKVRYQAVAQAHAYEFSPIG